MKSKHKVAIIMRSLNEQPYVADTLKALENQSFKNFSVYHVDSGSTDGTLECIENHQSGSSKIKRIPPEDYVPGKVLNEAIKETEEPLIVLLNADAIPSNDQWLENLIKPILEGESEATLSCQEPRSSAYFIVKDDYRRGYNPERFKNRPLDMFSAVSCAFKRNIWEQTPFYTEGYAEDLLWFHQCRQAGARFQMVDSSRVEHSHNYTLTGLYRKRYRHGVALASQEGVKISLGCTVWNASREIARDFLTACRSLQFHTIPYNIAYRLVIHWAYYRGAKSEQSFK